MTTDHNGLAPFQPLGAYDWPAMPTEHALRTRLRRLARRFKSDDDKPFIADERLRRAQLSQSEESDPPACRPLLEELDASLAPWVGQTRPDSWLQLVIVPPCDRQGIVLDWAQRNGHQVLAPPERGELLHAQPRLPVLEGAGVLVIPQLERWYLRHRNGLAWVRALLPALERLERHCVIGCGSWAWQFLRKSALADFMMPTGVTFQAFDAERLHRWLSELAQKRAGESTTFRLASSGEKLLALGDTQAKPHPYFQQLAASSLGIPWVAWHLWTRSLRARIESADYAGSIGSADSAKIAESSRSSVEAADEDDRTMWVSALDEFNLPGRQHQTTVLTLHALLLHDALTMAELTQVLPDPDVLPTVAALAKAGLVERREGRVRCRTAAYPSIRQALSAAGMPLDRL